MKMDVFVGGVRQERQVAYVDTTARIGAQMVPVLRSNEEVVFTTSGEAHIINLGPCAKREARYNPKPWGRFE